MIRYVKRQEIDSEKWNDCIDRSLNSLIYAYSFYLDNMSDHWDALILGDYEYVMPLTWRRKFGFRYLYPPPFTQQGGVFSQLPIAPGIVQDFLHIATQHFRYADVYLNYACADRHFKTHSNFLLNLTPTYPQLRDGYKRRLKDNLRTAAKHKMFFASSHDYQQVLHLFESRYASQIGTITHDGFNRFGKLLNHQSHRFNVLVRTVTLESNEMVAAALLLMSGCRMYLLLPYVSDNGRTMRANHFLIDRVIHEFSERNFVFDFEGSDIPGIASFYQNFGAIDQPYFFYQHNHLPPLVRAVKQIYSRVLK